MFKWQINLEPLMVAFPDELILAPGRRVLVHREWEVYCPSRPSLMFIFHCFPILLLFYSHACQYETLCILF